MRVLILLSLAVLASCSTRNDERVNRPAKLDSLFLELFTNNEFNGAVLVAEKGEILLEKGYGLADAASKLPFTAETPSNSASLAKQFVAMAAMQLKEKGKLDYDSKVNEVLPDFPYDTISIRHLLTHTSGLPDYIELTYTRGDTTRVLGNSDVRKLFSEFKPALLFTPGSKFEYSNTGYLFLTMVVEAVSGMNLGEYAKQNIFEPAGMSTASVYSLELGTFPDNGARGFRVVDGKSEPFDLIWMDGVYGDGNFYFSVTDLYKWHEALSTNKLVSASNFSEAITPYILNNGKPTRYGFGWFVNPQKNITWHTGTWQGFYNLLYRDLANDRVVIFLDNHSMTHRVSVAKAILDILDGKAVHFPYPESLTTEIERNDIVGSYIMPAGDTLRITSGIAQLEISNGRGHQPIYQLTQDQFYVPNWDVTIQSQLEDNKVSAIRVFNIDEALGKRIN